MDTTKQKGRPLGRLVTVGVMAAVLAVLAGNDMLITSDYQNDIPAVLAAVADGRIAEREIDAHVLRILRYKQAQGWIE